MTSSTSLGRKGRDFIVNSFGDNKAPRGMGGRFDLFGNRPAPSPARPRVGSGNRISSRGGNIEALWAKRDRTALFAIAIGIAHGLWTKLTGGALFNSAVGAIVLGAVAYAAGLWLLAPVGRYVNHVQRLASGDFDDEIPASSDKQFAVLASSLEAMRLHLRAWMSQIARNAIEFEGSLQVLDLVHVMHFLRAGKRTGTLLLQRGGETAMLFWRDGEVCGALVDGLAGSVALNVPFAWERGSFKFSPRLDPVANLDSRWEVLLLNGVRSVQQPRIWSRFIAKKTIPVRRSRLADHMPLRQLLTSDEWAVWNALTGELSVEELSNRLGEPMDKIWHTLYCFAALGVVEPADNDTEFIHLQPPAQTFRPASSNTVTVSGVASAKTKGTKVALHPVGKAGGHLSYRGGDGGDNVGSERPIGSKQTVGPEQTVGPKQKAAGDNVIPIHRKRLAGRERYL